MTCALCVSETIPAITPACSYANNALPRPSPRERTARECDSRGVPILVFENKSRMALGSTSRPLRAVHKNGLCMNNSIIFQ